MSAYTTGYKVRYGIPSLQQQAEFAVVTAADQIKNEDPGAPDHADRLAWAAWIDHNSAIGVIAFMWPLALNPTIQSAVATDPTGATVGDTDVQFVVNSHLQFVIDEWVAHPPA